MRVHKAGEGALVHAQRMEQTISPTLHGRTCTNTSSCANVCASAKLLQRQEWPGNVCNIRKCSSRTSVCVCVPYTNEGYVRCRQPWSRGYFAEGSSSVQVES